MSLGEFIFHVTGAILSIGSFSYYYPLRRSDEYFYENLWIWGSTGFATLWYGYVADWTAVTWPAFFVCLVMRARHGYENLWIWVAAGFAMLWLGYLTDWTVPTWIGFIVCLAMRARYGITRPKD